VLVQPAPVGEGAFGLLLNETLHIGQVRARIDEDRQVAASPGAIPAGLRPRHAGQDGEQAEGAQRAEQAEQAEPTGSGQRAVPSSRRFARRDGQHRVGVLTHGRRGGCGKRSK